VSRIDTLSEVGYEFKRGLAYTGAIWEKSRRSRAQTVRRVCEALERTYGRPRFGNPEEPLDDLVYIMLSNRTLPEMAQQVYARIQKEFKTWDDVIASPDYLLASIIQSAGLYRIKSTYIRAALEKVRADFGYCDLNYLKDKPVADIQEYLISLPGVSLKVAKCIMMYTMGASVLPVDGHVYRVTQRLGWTRRNRADQCHKELEALVPPKRRFAFHVDCIAHGRTTCRPTNHLCERCPVSNHCLYFRNLA